MMPFTSIAETNRIVIALLCPQKAIQ